MIESYNKKLYYQEEELKIELKTAIPRELYKYYSLSNYSLDSLINNNIHFSHPYTLNDIMDGNLKLWDIKEFYLNFLEETRSKISEQKLSKIILQEHSNEYYKHRGVLCLTDSYDNNLFWPHYTSEQGFCIEFNSEKFLKSFDNEEIKTFPISYEPLKRINLNDHIIKTRQKSKMEINIDLPLLYALSFKDEIWKYENEWRILLKKKNLGEISHPLNTLSDIKYNIEKKNIQNRNIPFHGSSINKIILSILFFNKERFNFQNFYDGHYTFFFREKHSKDHSLLIKFLETLKNKFNDRIFQLDRDLNFEKNVFENKIFFKIEIIDLNFDQIVIRRIKL